MFFKLSWLVPQFAGLGLSSYLKLLNFGIYSLKMEAESASDTQCFNKNARRWGNSNNSIANTVTRTRRFKFLKNNKYPSNPPHGSYFFPKARQPLLAQGLLWTSDQPDTETHAWHHITLSRDRYLCPRWVSNSQSQHTSGGRPTPYTARPLGSAHGWYRKPQKHWCFAAINLYTPN